MINSFRNEHGFLSNFLFTPVVYEGIVYKTSEHAYQAAKTLDLDKRKEIADLSTPGEAKRAGRALKARSDWNDVRYSVMETILRSKFSHRGLSLALLRTNPYILVEGNYWHDNYWGDCYCDVCKAVPGDNNLGKLLMAIRNDLLNQEMLPVMDREPVDDTKLVNSLL